MYACDKRSNTFIPTAIRNRRKGLRCAKVEARCGARTRDSQIKSLINILLLRPLGQPAYNTAVLIGILWSTNRLH
uniref:Uncharacterized protein n=1 Tax=Heterorhabditis bacteriophora TaxID=37862 RepID=A0A1I7WDC8_HETBA